MCVGLPVLMPAQIPSIVQNPDTLVDESPDIFSGTTAPVLGSATISLASISELDGADFGGGVINLTTGEVLAQIGSGQYSIDDPDIFLLAFAVELMQNGELSPDTVVGRDITIADEFWWAFHGCRESAARAMWTIGLESLSAWVVERGMSDTELHDVQLEWEGAPETEQSVSSVGDIILALSIIHSGMDIPAVVEIMENPEVGDGQASEVGADWDMCGWVDEGQEHKTFFLIARRDGRNDIGLILLADKLCCIEKADLAMLLLWEAAIAE